MYAHQTKLASAEVQELRREGGRYLRELREARGLSQRQMATLIGADFYTFVSQIETGRGRIPPDRYRVWALRRRQGLGRAPDALLRSRDLRDPVRCCGDDRAAIWDGGIAHCMRFAVPPWQWGGVPSQHSPARLGHSGLFRGEWVPHHTRRT